MRPFGGLPFLIEVLTPLSPACPENEGGCNASVSVLLSVSLPDVLCEGVVRLYLLNEGSLA